LFFLQNRLPTVSFAYIIFTDSSFAKRTQKLLPTAQLPTCIITYKYYCLQCSIAYPLLPYVHFCAQIKFLEIELLLPTYVLLPIVRLPTYIIAYSSIVYKLRTNIKLKLSKKRTYIFGKSVM